METDISVGEGHFRCGMIAPGNHLFRRFAALCNTLPQRIDNHDAGLTHPTTQNYPVGEGF